MAMKNSISLLLRKTLGLLAIFCVFGAPASATILPPGSGAPPDVFGSIAGSLLDKITGNWSGTGFTLNYSAEVVKVSGTTAVCPAGGCLDFVFQFSNSTSITFPR